MYSYTLPSTSALDRGGWSTPRFGRFIPGKTQYASYKRMSGLQGRSGGVRKSRYSIPGPSGRTTKKKKVK